MINEIKSVIEKHKDHIPVIVMAELLTVLDGAECHGGMKQIFDWMRRQPLKAFKVYDGTIGIEPPEVHRLINEAEAKWEAEVCEWKQEKYLNFALSTCTTSCGKRYDIIDTFKFCPYCGKPIKIVEVE